MIVRVVLLSTIEFLLLTFLVPVRTLVADYVVVNVVVVLVFVVQHTVS